MRIILLKVLKFIATAALEKFLSSKASSLSKLIQAEEKIQSKTTARETKLANEYEDMKRIMREISDRKLTKAADKRQKIEQL